MRTCISPRPLLSEALCMFSCTPSSRSLIWSTCTLSGLPHHRRKIASREGPLLAVGVEEIRPATAAESQIVDPDPGSFEVYPYGVLQREVAARDHLFPEPGGERRGQLRRHLVAAAAYRRSYIGLHALP